MKKTIISMGEILWDMLPNGAVLGGAPFNFAFRAHTLGHISYMVSRLGSDELGIRAWDKLRDLGMDTRFMQTDPIHPTGTVDIILDDNNQPDYTINPGAAYDYMKVSDELLEAASHADCICFGTLAQRQSYSRHTIQTLVEHAGNAVTLLDINLRKDCYDDESILTSLQKANILKLNHEEVDLLKPILPFRSESMIDFAHEIIKQYDLRLCVLTLGAEGVLAVSTSGEVVYEPGFQIDLVDPCGSGDAFTAAFMDQWFKEKTLTRCCQYGNALGAMVATHSGATTLIQPYDIETFLHNPPARTQNDTFMNDNPY